MAPVSRPAVRAWRKFSSNCATFTSTSSPAFSPGRRRCAARALDLSPSPHLDLSSLSTFGEGRGEARGERVGVRWVCFSSECRAEQRAELSDVVAEFHAVYEGLDLARTRRAQHAFGRSAESCTHV